jgi:hypothetical protein
MNNKELTDLYESYVNIYEAPFEITGPHSYRTGDGRFEDDSTIRNSPTVVGVYKGDNKATRKRAETAANRRNQEYGTDVYKVTRVAEPRKRGTPVDEARTDISYAREAIRNARENLKKYPQGHKGDDFRHEHKLAKGAFKNLVNQERGKLKDSVEYVLDYLIDEGFTDSYDSALVILETMSDEWFEDLIESAKEQSDKQIDKGVKTTYKAQNVLDNLHQGRSRGLERIDRRKRDDKVKRMRGRLKTRRDDLFAERGRREYEKMAKLKKLLGM